MKYEVRIYRTEIHTETVECATPEEAIANALSRHPAGFKSDEATEILESGESGKTFERVDTCENCGGWIWAGDESVMTEDDITLCPACAKVLEIEAPIQTRTARNS